MSKKSNSMKSLTLKVREFKVNHTKDNIELNIYIDVEQLVNSLSVNEIEENIHKYEKLFIIMKNYYRKEEERDDSFFK